MCYQLDWTNSILCIRNEEWIDQITIDHIPRDLCNFCGHWMNFKPNNHRYSVVSNLCLDAGFRRLLRNISNRYRFIRSFIPVK